VTDSNKAKRQLSNTLTTDEKEETFEVDKGLLLLVLMLSTCT